MDSSLYPDGFPHHTRALYRPDPKEAVIEWELPPQSVIPLERDYRYVATRDAIDALPRAEKEIKERYRAVIAQVALRTIHEILISRRSSRLGLTWSDGAGLARCPQVKRAVPTFALAA
jgi:hypothetical protein